MSGMARDIRDWHLKAGRPAASDGKPHPSSGSSTSCQKIREDRPPQPRDRGRGPRRHQPHRLDMHQRGLSQGSSNARHCMPWRRRHLLSEEPMTGVGVIVPHVEERHAGQAHLPPQARLHRAHLTIVFAAVAVSRWIETQVFECQAIATGGWGAAGPSWYRRS
jgi:hypothetical protein